MNFDRKSKELYGEQPDWLDCRMIAFKHNLMNRRILYWDIVDSTKMEVVKRRNVQQLLIEYMDDLSKRHPEDISDFSITENTRRIKGSFYQRKYWSISGGDNIILGVSPSANIQRITDELSTEVLGGGVGRTAIGYYTGNNDFFPPGYDMFVLDFQYLKHQMALDQINDTRPSKDQIDEYYRENSEHVKRMELIHKENIYLREEPER